MQEFQVTCIHKPHWMSSHEHITHIGNPANGWCLTRESAIRRIESGEQAFYTLEARTLKKMYIGVVRAQGRAPYLRTYADGVWNDNLLAQAECPDTCKVID